MLLAVRVDPEQRPLRALLSGWTGKPALLGLASGTAFAFDFHMGWGFGHPDPVMPK